MLTMKEIGKIVSEQSNSVAETNVKYEGIAVAIEKMNQLIAAIHQSGQEMQYGKEHIIDIMQNLSAISEENAAGTEEGLAAVEQQTVSMEDIAKASEELTSLAIDLQNLVVKFQA